MKWFERTDVKWMVILALVGAWILRILMTTSMLLDLAVSILGLTFVVLGVYLHRNAAKTPQLFWDESSSTLGVIRGWTVEAVSARLMGSVPIGIDLSHSARKVLQAVYARYLDGPSAELSFFVCRPLGSSPTRVGMIVKRKTLRFWNGVSRIDLLKDQVVNDAAILESAMRAAYPHLPVTKAGRDEVLMVLAGGIDSIAGTS
ncbi:MAG: hypothetical protein ACFFAY_15710 [Promethearchaeota archaeon]